ncbi:MAG: MAE_28990/MAE_18760 family HEPN-like nuclease [Armatimonadota bacterium]
MNEADIRAQLEDELTWRHNEIRLLHNQLSNIDDEIDKRRFRKALVVMLYAHYEGFCKTALSIYADAVNQEKMRCGDVTACIAAASLADVFKEFESSFKKSDIFRRVLPDDSQLHRYCRQVDLLSVLHDIWDMYVQIPVESVVDTESNLMPAVMRKMLYRLGFSHDSFKTYDGDIHFLLECRNGIAHGYRKDGLEESLYIKLQSATYEIMDGLVSMITEAVASEAYKGMSAAVTP